MQLYSTIHNLGGLFPIYGNILNYADILILFKTTLKEKESQIKGLLL